MVLSLMTLLVRLECPLGRLRGRPCRTRLDQSGFDAESHGLRMGAQAITASDETATDDELDARNVYRGR
jgi:hypothetical protein